MPIAVSAVTGIGPKTADYLHTRGIESAEALLQAGVEVLAEAPGFGEARAQSVLIAAEQLVGAGAPRKSATKPAKKKKSRTRDKKKKNEKGKRDGKSGKKNKKDSDKKKKKGKKEKKGKKKKK